ELADGVVDATSGLELALRPLAPPTLAAEVVGEEGTRPGRERGPARRLGGLRAGHQVGDEGQEPPRLVPVPLEAPDVPVGRLVVSAGRVQLGVELAAVALEAS